MNTLDMSLPPAPMSATSQVNALLDQAADFLRKADPHAAVARATNALLLAEQLSPGDLGLRDNALLVRDRCLLALYEERAEAVHRAREHADLEAAAQAVSER